MDTRQTESTQEEHSLIITDVRFRPNSTQLATSSFDRLVKLWDSAQVRIGSFLTLPCFFSILLCGCALCVYYGLGQVRFERQ